MNSLLESAKQEAGQALGRLKQLLETTPDDKLDWRPSESARSVSMVLAHCCEATGHIHNMLKGKPFPVSTSQEAEVGFIARDTRLKGRQALMAALDESYGRFLEWLDQASEDDLSAMATLPFGLGEAPVSLCLNAVADHTKGHVGQIEYIQTMYGDRDWHTGF